MEKNRNDLDVKKPPSNPKKEEDKPNKRKTVSTPGACAEQVVPEEVISKPRQVVQRISKRHTVSYTTEMLHLMAEILIHRSLLIYLISSSRFHLILACLFIPNAPYLILIVSADAIV